MNDHTSPTTLPARDDLYSLVYSSFATAEFDERHLQALLAESRRANALNEITGLLLYRDGRFIQFLEGPEKRVTTLLARISDDPRHRDVRVMTEGRPSARHFDDWTMGYATMDEPHSPLPPGFRSTFDDLDDTDDADSVLRATRELSLWFRVRAHRH